MGSHLQVAHGLFTALSGSQNKAPALAEVADFEQADIDRLVPILPGKRKRRGLKGSRGSLTVCFTYRPKRIRIIGAGYCRKGKKIYERENKIH